ncbi:MAG: hypothetical protein EXR71_11860 [Myxococcales bacterium]|nr:hypothetical protein [Myxococcales bacterium]
MLFTFALVGNSAWAHSPTFGMAAMSARMDAPAEVWGMTDGWGLAHSLDGGTSWTWLCEEAVGIDTVYDVLAYADGVALTATAGGLLRVDDACAGRALDGVPAGFAFAVTAYGGGAAAAVIGPDEGGVVFCDDERCTPSALWQPRLYPKALVVDGETLWASVVWTDTLASGLFRSTDGLTFEEVYRWPPGQVDPRVVFAAGDDVLVWTRPRSEAALPALEKSVDGGRTFLRTFEQGFHTDATPGVLVDGSVVLLGTWFGARTWRSDDLGGSFVEVSAEAPAIRCGVRVGDAVLTCADHLADGYSVATTDDLVHFAPLACLEESLPAACAEAACAPYVDAWVSAGAYGGGRCGVDSGEPAEPPPEAGCGCSGWGSTGGGLGLLGVGLVGRRASGSRRQNGANT